jgi:excisionase family DNA binding protein
MRIQALATHPDAFVTVRELAAYWVVSPRQIYKHIGTGSLPAVNVGRRAYRIPTKAAAEFEQRMIVRPSSLANQSSRDVRPAPSFALIRGNDAAVSGQSKAEDGGWPRAVVSADAPVHVPDPE